MIRFSTDDIRPQDRFAHWCEVRSRNLFGVTIELERDRRDQFNGSFWAKDIGGAVASEMRASSYHMERTKADIIRRSVDSLIIGLQVKGAGVLQTRAHSRTVGNGALVIGHSDIPFVAVPKTSMDFHFLSLKIPLDGDILHGITVEDLTPDVVALHHPVFRPLQALFATLLRRARLDGRSPADSAHILRLALIARGRLPAGAQESRAAIRRGLLEVAREIMERDLDQHGLVPEAVAREIGISVRQLHILFEPTGQSFARSLAAMRMQRAKRQLETRPQRSIAEIAQACGFDSIATFYRVFNASYGLTPGDFRDRHAGT